MARTKKRTNSGETLTAGGHVAEALERLDEELAGILAALRIVVDSRDHFDEMGHTEAVLYLVRAQSAPSATCGITCSTPATFW